MERRPGCGVSGDFPDIDFYDHRFAATTRFTCIPGVCSSYSPSHNYALVGLWGPLSIARLPPEPPPLALVALVLAGLGFSRPKRAS